MEIKPEPSLWDRIANRVVEAATPPPTPVVTPEMEKQMRNDIGKTFQLKP